MIEVRKANKFDMPHVFEMIKKFQKQEQISGDLTDSLDFAYLTKLYHHMIVGGGLVLVATDDSKVIGMILGIKNNNIWFPHQIALKEMMIWVDEEYRDKGVGYKLVTQYNSIAEQMMNTKEINQYTMSVTKGFGKLNYEKFGYKKIEETWAVGDR